MRIRCVPVIECFLQHSYGERLDQAGLFGVADEHFGRQQTVPRMPPSRQRLQTSDPTGFQVDQRLIFADEFVPFDAFL